MLFKVNRHEQEFIRQPLQPTLSKRQRYTCIYHKILVFSWDFYTIPSLFPIETTRLYETAYQAKSRKLLPITLTWGWKHHTCFIPVNPLERDFLAKGDRLPAAAAFFASLTRLSLAVTPAATDNWSTSPSPISHNSFRDSLLPLRLATLFSLTFVSPNKGSKFPDAEEESRK